MGLGGGGLTFVCFVNTCTDFKNNMYSSFFLLSLKLRDPNGKAQSPLDLILNFGKARRAPPEDLPQVLKQSVKKAGSIVSKAALESKRIKTVQSPLSATKRWSLVTLRRAVSVCHMANDFR